MTLSILMVLILLAAIIVVFAFEWISVDMAADPADVRRRWPL